MAGKQQHFIPQFLQKGFSSRSSKTEHYVWVYRKGVKPFNPNTKGIGQERYFYSNATDTQIDDAITDHEDNFATFCDQMRHAPNNIDDLNQKASRLLAHIEVRSKNIRESFISTSQIAFDAIFEIITDPLRVQRFIENRLKKDPLNFFDEHIPKQGVRPIQRLMAAKRMRLDFLGSGKLTEGAELMATFLATKREEMPELISGGIRAGQIGVLKESVVPPKRVKLFKKLEYEIASLPNLYLGDSMLILLVEENGRRVFKTVMSENEKCLAVFLPLDVNTALIGRAPNIEIDPERFIEMISSCSCDFFIADKRDKQLQQESELIGKNNNLLSDKVIDEIVTDILNDQEFQ